MTTRTPRRLPSLPPPLTPRAFSCQCGRPVFFRNSVCLACGTPLGYDPETRRLWPLEATGETGVWQRVGQRRGRRWRRCSHLESPAACNWLVDVRDPFLRNSSAPPLCRCCRLTRTLPDLSVPENGPRFAFISAAQRRLVSTLLGLGLPVQSKAEDPAQGMAFDLLQAPPGGIAVSTGHQDGVITLDIEEADDATREQRRSALHEPYRTLLGHLRHETGHHYWQRLVEHGSWLEPFRELFGDERNDYAAALQRHHAEGPPADWADRHVSAYASAHPWEDWAETWAHYLHLVDTLDTARSFGLDGERVELSYERFDANALDGSGDPAPQAFLALVRSWMELTGVLNELSRSMGITDFYPFVLSRTALRKLHFVHRVVGAPLR